MELDEDNKPAGMEQDADNKPAVEKNSTVGMHVDAVDKGKKTMKKRWTLKFDEYIYEVLKQVHPDIAISGKALDMMNNIINKMMLKISKGSVKSINLRSGISTICQRDISASVRKLFPKQLGDRALYKAFDSSLYYSLEELCEKINKTKV